jgi:ring-1,2-phenylacetyl-CoA epoxidase subunit PaaD
MSTHNDILSALESVKDPEIPFVSIVEMGLIADVQVGDDSARVKITPTFAGCPAVEVMRAESEKTLRALGIKNVSVQITFDPPWDSNRISEEGRRKLKEFGLAPPMRHNGSVDLIQIQFTACPFCGSENTKLESLFGPTLCRAIHYCNNCQQSFEQFKPV